MQRVWLKFTLVIIAILASSLGLATITIVDDLRSVLRDMTVVRFGLTAREIKRSIEDGLNLGFGLGNLRQVQAAIERQHALDQDISDISVFGTDRTILFASSAGDVGEKVPEDWINRPLDPRRGIWYQPEDDQAGKVGTYIEDNLGRQVGGVVVSFQSSRAQLVWERLVAGLMTTSLIILAAALPLLALACWWAWRPVARPLAEIADALSGLERGDAPPALIVDPDKQLFAAQESFNRFAVGYRQSKAMLEDAAADLDRADG